MLNPILNNRKFQLAYIIAWMLFIISQFSFLFYFYNFPLYEAIIDSLVFNLLYAILGISVWYIVQSANFSNNNHFYSILNHTAAMSFMVAIAFSAGYRILKFTFENDTGYMYFLQNSIPWRLGSGILFYMLLALVFYLMLYIENLKEKSSAESNLKSLLKDAELKALKSQINPHFLFNSLNSINALCLSDPSKAQDMIIKLSTYLRYSLKNKEENLTSLAQELQNSKLYLEIEKVRFGKKLNFVNEIDNNCLQKNLPGMILQPLYENAIKYSIYECLEPVTITTKCTVNDKFLEITVTNNFDSDSTNQKGEGIGLSNIRKRLYLVYRISNLLKITKHENIFEVKVLIPFESHLSE